MNNELIMVFLPALSWLLFALGGTKISESVPGWKGWRRFVLPFVYMLFCLICKVSWWQTILVTLTSIFVFTLGYGSKTPWWKKILVGIGYGLISASILISWWNLFTTLGFIILFILSNTKLTKNIFVWKICEGFFGLLVGIQLAFALMFK